MIMRGRILFAIVVGLTFQFFQYFRYEVRILESTLNPQGNGSSQSMTSNTREVEMSRPIITAAQTEFKDNSVQEQKYNPMSTMMEQTPTAEREPQTEEVPSRNQVSSMSESIARDILRRVARGNEVPPTPMPSPRATIPNDERFDDAKQAIASQDALPPPKLTNQSTVVLVLSARQNFERRAAIRSSWSKDNDNVYFIIGGPQPGNQHDTNRNNPESISSRLFREQEQYGDIIDAIHAESYKSLPYKMHYGMKWVMKNLKNIDWVVKADDDQVVRVRRLQFFILRTLNPSLPIVLGKIVVGGRPHRTGKWKEDPHFKDPIYPPWPFGSAGYVVSRPIVQYLAETNDLYYYQGEDAGLGIWLDESPLQVTFLDTPELQKEEGCNKKLHIIGHGLAPNDIRNCFSRLGDRIPDQKRILSFTAARKDQHPAHIAS